ncbi:MAG TPA: methylmalonyl-CoA mutase family protein [Bacteroidales bacterium]|jgi:methylmalonyl-CoA mutase|nr:methylmalonyl-CoA mutase family protein [Bacteroidales bacterium]
MEKNDHKLFSEFPPVSTAEWEAKIIEDLKGADYQKKLIWKTPEGIDVKPYYRAEDLDGIMNESSYPGVAPFIRGNSADGNNWEIRQEIPLSDPIEANRIARDAFAKGAISLGFDTSGILSVNDLEVLLKGIPFPEASLYLGAASSYPTLLKLISGYAAKRKLPPTFIRGSIDFDPISYILLSGNFWKSQEDDLAEVAEIVKLGKELLPNLKVINVNGQYFHNAGATLVQELAFSMASANEYLAYCNGNGLTVDDVSPRLGFAFGIGSNYFMEIAKLRAARLLWSRIASQYKPGNADSLKTCLHSTTSHWNKTVYDPHVNILRTTTEAMSAILGGANSVLITPFDTFYKDADDFSERIARNQQVILREEAYLGKVADAGAGSYYIESLTHSIAEAAWKLFLEVEEMGGMIEAIKKNFIQESIEKIASQRLSDIVNRRTFILGTNQYPNTGEMMLGKIQMIDEEVEPESADGKPAIFKKLEIGRGAEAFDDLRLNTEIFVNEGGKRPAVFLLTMGNLAMRKARAMFSTNFFGCAGYEIIDNNGFKTVEEGVRAAISSEAEIVVICSSDEEYAEIASPLVKAIKDQNDKTLVVLAGYPKELIESLKNDGFDEFIHVRSNLLETLRNIQKKLGIAG